MVNFVLGFILGNILNLIELIAVWKMNKKIEIMLSQFKAEGKSDKWLK